MRKPYFSHQARHCFNSYSIQKTLTVVTGRSVEGWDWYVEDIIEESRDFTSTHIQK